MEVNVKVLFRDGKSVYGVIIDHLEGERVEEMRFVPNNRFGAWRETEDPRLVEKLNPETILEIDGCLK